MTTGHSVIRAAAIAASIATGSLVSMASPAWAAPVSNPIAPASGPGQAPYEDGVKAMAQGNLELAQKSFERSLSLEPKRVQSILALAEIARLRDNDAAAEKYLIQARQLAPADPTVNGAWAKWLNSQRRFDEARIALEEAVALTPDAAPLWTDLGVLYARALNNKPKAIEAFREALKRDPKLAGAHFALGTLMAETGARAQAEGEFEAAAKLEPKDPRPYEAIGKLHADAGEFGQALTAYEKALAADPKYVSARIAVGDVHLHTKNFDQAAAAFTAAVEINPLADGAWLRLGLLEQERGRLDLAEQAYRKAIKVNPTQAFALNNLAAMLNARAGSQDEALAFAQRAVDVAGNAVFLDTLAQIHRSRGELQKAAEALKLAAARAPNDAPVHYRLGVVLEDLKENAAAVAAYKRALAINGRFADADAARKRLAAIDKTN